jgi:hypothetical protein
MIPFRLHVEGLGMRGSDARSGSLFSYVDLENRALAKHPLRVIAPAGIGRSIKIEEPSGVMRCRMRRCRRACQRGRERCELSRNPPETVPTLLRVAH